MAIPMGVVREKSVARRYFLFLNMGGRVAIWVPRAKPSKTWWNVITMERSRKPPATSGARTRVRPITVGKIVSSFFCFCFH